MSEVYDILPNLVYLDELPCFLIIKYNLIIAITFYYFFTGEDTPLPVLGLNAEVYTKSTK